MLEWVSISIIYGCLIIHPETQRLQITARYYKPQLCRAGPQTRGWLFCDSSLPHRTTKVTGSAGSSSGLEGATWLHQRIWFLGGDNEKAGGLK